MHTPLAHPKLESVSVSTYTVPTETEEADGTFTWSKTTLVLVQAAAGGCCGTGYTYADRATAVLIHDTLREAVLGCDPMSVTAAWAKMCEAVRNLGNSGVSAMAISAVDTALWDLKARLLGVPLVSLLGQVRAAMPIYGSGGFCNYSNDKLREQLRGWIEAGIPRVKMKIGRDAAADRGRVRAARQAIGPAAALFVDANGAYSVKEALAQAERFDVEAQPSWFEEPVSSDDLAGLAWLRMKLPAPMEVAAGEYGYDLVYFRRMLESSAVDVLQADVTRCRGFTGFLQVGALCDAFQTPLSAHCAPALHVHPACAVSRLRHAEYFFDHVRIERLFFDGVPKVKDGALKPELAQPGHGLTFKQADAERYRQDS
jgi:L-alanine-DL-glutamate epimerase-like enolase superfamily enzyme